MAPRTPSLAIAIAAVLAGCSEPAPRRETAAPPAFLHDPESGTTRARIAPSGEPAVTLQSGARVPVRLPPGFTLYPGARVITNTVIERDGHTRVLLTFATPDRLEAVMLFYRGQAVAAGVDLTLDLNGDSRASLGGHTPQGLAFVLAARRDGAGTRGELSVG